MEKVPDKYQLRISDLPGEIRAIAELIGLKATLKIASEYSGETIYIPKHDSITRAVRDRAIREEYTGANHKELAKKFNLTTRIIRKIIDEK
ncbi:MAG: DNA-binding protein [Proteobacteria bacterium]|nr:DNA-binding protein [Desulfobacula sp.]MBU4132809.1 DNA-binding protein [Pseudomonadota bacterium]